MGSIVLCVISCRGQRIITGIGGTLESYYIDRLVLHQEACYLQKICALEKTQAAKKLIVSSCPPTTSALLLYHYYTTAVWPVRTANNNAAIRTYTLLLYHHCCIMSTYRCKCFTPTKLSPPWPVRTANITTMGITF